jgi:dTDP-4-dehydrorhamnose 3,5-epimerase
MEFEFKKGEIDGIVFIKRKYFPDNRGSLTKEYESTPFYETIKESFKEEYISVSKKYVLRGLHFQKSPKPQGKLISVIKGEIFDVAVDLREPSKDYLKHITKYMSAESRESIWIPPGFAHGFLSLSEESVVINRCTNEFDPSLEGGVRWDDPKLNIEWPIKAPVLSEKDKTWALL